MSKEMWEFDINGDLYFEKTVNGFFVELFEKWKEMKCTHSVTIVYFSRLFYNENMLNNISEKRRISLGCDYQGRLYEDIYQVVVHEERREDWFAIIVKLKKHFIQYPESLKKEGFSEGYLSSASEGNFLEVLNLGANVFEKAYIDRSLEVTGQQMVVITPGAGMFEVDREMATMTKRRIVDNGMSADLVCMAEQPLHSVPLLKFHGKSDSSTLIGDDYGIPHWINHSFYTSKSQENQRNSFVPRITVPDLILQHRGDENNRNSQTFLSGNHLNEVEENKLPDFVDYEAYDAEVFKCAHTKPRPQTLTPGYNPYTRSRGIEIDDCRIERFLKKEKMVNYGDDNSAETHKKIIKRPDSGGLARSLGVVKSFDFMLPCSGEEDSIDDGSKDFLSSYSPPPASSRAVVGSADTSFFYQNVGRPQRSLVNPFRPNYLPCKMTCNRHRWRHTFPKGPGGEMWQEHHHKASDHVTNQVDDDALLRSLDPGYQVELGGLPKGFEEDETDGPDFKPDDKSTSLTALSQLRASFSSKHAGISLQSLGWVQNLHAPSEKDWTAAMKTSVDWKSLTIPACLPLTTDYHLDQRLLDSRYSIYAYNLYLGVEESSSNQDDVDCVVMRPENQLKEFILQRIGQGFQLVCSDIPKERTDLFSPLNHPRSAVIPQGTQDEVYNFMMGRNFHRLTYTPSENKVSFTRYHPTHVIDECMVSYPYWLWSDCTQEYVRMDTTFVHDDLTHYNWNYMDQYIVRDSEFSSLIKSLHYWRIRLALLPLKQPTCEGSLSSDGQKKENEVQFKYFQGFLRFLETVNRIRRPPVTKVEAKKTPSKSRRPSAPAMLKSPASAVRSHRRSRSGGGGKDLETLNEDGVVILDASSPGHDMSSTPPRRRSSSSENEDTVNSIPSLEEIVKEMTAKETGLNFLSEMRGLPPKSFLGTDATSWVIRHISVKSRAEAVTLCQKMLDEGFIRHASGSILQPFVDGFYLYYILKTADKKSALLKRPDKHSDGLAYKKWMKAQDDKLFQFETKWFEVVLKERGSESSNSPVGVFESDEKGQPQRSKRIPAYRDAEINLDSTSINLNSSRKDRPEWCTVRYPGVFCPDNVYLVHLHWLVASGSVINQLVQSWARKVTLYGFHLVPVPTFQPDGQLARSDPFTSAHHIPLDVTWLREHASFQDISKQEFKTRVFLFQEAILKRFGFIKDFPYNDGIYSCYKDGHNSVFRYIHYTGGLFMTLVNDDSDSFGYVWTLNYTITKRWKSSVTLDQDAIRTLVKDLRTFCENEEGKLEKYLESFTVKSQINFDQTQGSLGNDVFERVLEACPDD
ncbi:GATOR complex protein DEPDC5-like isoform X2 [Dendronephthya gigantea]|nr:GATOR complex protein DEPDC5-like isoform X2 [Dendronephthya gigantea]